MSFCTWLLKRLFEATVVFLLITFLPGLPPDLQFTVPYSVTPPRDLVGPLAVNDKLNGAERLFENEIKSPEGFAVANNTLYTGLAGGHIVKLQGDKLVPVANIGHECAGHWDEKTCGRPLHMQFDRHGMLYVIDAYYGIYKINVKTGTKQHLVSTAEPIEGKMAKLANSIAVANDGTVYWTVSSCDIELSNGVLAMLGDGSGRVFKYDPIKKTNTLLLDNINFANGIALSAKEDFLVVAETLQARIFRIWLSGPKKGTSEVFVDGLPGLPDNMRPNGKGGFFVSLIVPRTKEMPTLTDLLGPHPILRRFLARLLGVLQAPFELIQRYYPNDVTGLANFWINNFESVNPLLPKGVMVLGISESGEIIESLQSTDDKVSSISDLVFVDQTYYLGSPYNKYLGRVKTRIPIHIKVSTTQPPATA